MPKAKPVIVDGDLYLSTHEASRETGVIRAVLSAALASNADRGVYKFKCKGHLIENPDRKGALCIVVDPSGDIKILVGRDKVLIPYDHRAGLVNALSSVSQGMGPVIIEC